MYPEAEIMIEQEDRQSLETPIVPKVDNRKYDLYEGLETYYSTGYLKDLMKNQKIVRNICVAGHLHHGKTLLMDLLVQQAHVRKPVWNLEKNYRWLDTRVDEQ